MPEVSALKRWSSTWTGIGYIVVGMERQGYAVSLSQIPGNGWTASFAHHRLLAPAGRRQRGGRAHDPWWDVIFTPVSNRSRFSIPVRGRSLRRSSPTTETPMSALAP
jgi:hypothetical protein